MKNYQIHPRAKRFSNLDGLFLEEKIGIYLCDSFLKDHKLNQKYIELSFSLESAKKSSWKEFLDKEYLEGATPEQVKRKVGLAKKAEIVEALEMRLKEL